MCWIDDLLDFWFGDRGLSDGAEGSAVNDSPKGTALHLGGISASPSAPSLSPLPDPPEMYLRPELIPIKEPDGDTPATADKYVRWWSRMYANGARR